MNHQRAGVRRQQPHSPCLRRWLAGQQRCLVVKGELPAKPVFRLAGSECATTATEKATLAAVAEFSRGVGGLADKAECAVDAANLAAENVKKASAVAVEILLDAMHVAENASAAAGRAHQGKPPEGERREVIPIEHESAAVQVT